MNSSFPILALHGNLGLPCDWEKLGLADLQAPDLWDYASMDFESFARALAGSLSMGMKRPLLAGYSLGGRLALHTMALEPDRWSGAVILSSHPGLSSPLERKARMESDQIWAARARGWPWGKFLNEWNRQPVFSASSKKVTGCNPNCTATQGALETRREAVAMALVGWSLGKQSDLRESLRAFQHPVLWITGSRDTKFSAVADTMSEVFPKFRVEKIPGCGHRVLQEAPLIVAELITNFRQNIEVYERSHD